MCVCVFQALKGLCLDSKRSKVLQRLELSLDILGGTVERISNTAEVLGAVHQVLLHSPTPNPPSVSVGRQSFFFITFSNFIFVIFDFFIFNYLQHKFSLP